MRADTSLVVHARPEDQRLDEARMRLMLGRLHTGGVMTALRTELVEKANWRTWFRADPGLFLSVAFGVGFLLARRRA